MILFSQIALLLLTMILPLIFLIVFAYVKAQGWKPIALGVSLSIAVLVLVRMILPVLFLSQSWFKTLTEDLFLYIPVYSLCLALFYLAAGLLALRFWIRKDSLRIFIFGFSEGFAYEALFIGFNGLASLLSDHALQPSADAAGSIWLAALEAVSMLILFGGFALQLEKAVHHKKPVWALICALELFCLFCVGLFSTMVWSVPRPVQGLILLAASLAMAWWIHTRIRLNQLLAVEQDAEAYEFEEDRSVL